MSLLSRKFALSLILIFSVWGSWGADQAQVPWESLRKDQQTVLSHLTNKDRWDQLPAERQHRMLKGLVVWLHLLPDERVWVQNRLKEWKTLTPAQRGQIRQRFRRYLSLSAEQRNWAKSQYRRFKKMSPEKRDALRREWENMTEEERLQALEKQKGQGISAEQRRQVIEKLNP